ncbi:hypothetical protein PanWU01x14_300140 [Parasponia andersonii]|uniref:Uncharacterized protein n=1 Tax=Parasponia andersonii TaxID=3476 RepID=A0A2P5AU77_PARAD|nr:hypothetical protein PanWU01x14_300140 [Parasponia andersonii]
MQLRTQSVKHGSNIRYRIASPISIEAITTIIATRNAANAIFLDAIFCFLLVFCSLAKRCPTSSWKPSKIDQEVGIGGAGRIGLVEFLTG